MGYISQSFMKALLLPMIYGGEIDFPDRKTMTKTLRKGKWKKPFRYSRKWCKDGIAGWHDLDMAYNFEIYPDRVDKANPNFPFPREPNTSFMDVKFETGQTINIGLKP